MVVLLQVPHKQTSEMCLIPTLQSCKECQKVREFLWDMEQYFKAAWVPENEQVTITSMYLAGDAKLWWRTRVSDFSRPIVSTWAALKEELKTQFLPYNTMWIARDALKCLKQTGFVQDYVKQFSLLMLDIKSMSEEDKLFHFVSRLQGWVHMELRRQGVQTPAIIVAAVDALVDFRQS